jgi:hypothetical protein
MLFAAVIGGPVLIIAGIGEYRNSKQLQAHGKVTTAEVVKAEETVSRKGRHKFWLTIQFQPEQGALQTATSQVPSARFNRAVADKSIGLIYLPSKPKVFQFGDKAETRYGSIIFGCILLVGSLGFIGYLWIAQRSSKRASIPSPSEPMSIPASQPPVANDLQKAA